MMRPRVVPSRIGPVVPSPDPSGLNRIASSIYCIEKKIRGNYNLHTAKLANLTQIQRGYYRHKGFIMDSGYYKHRDNYGQTTGHNKPLN